MISPDKRAEVEESCRKLEQIASNNALNATYLGGTLVAPLRRAVALLRDLAGNKP